MFFNSRAEENTKKFTSARIAFYYRSPFPFSCHYLPSLSSLLSISTSSLSPPFLTRFSFALFYLFFFSFILYPKPARGNGNLSGNKKAHASSCLIVATIATMNQEEAFDGRIAIKVTDVVPFIYFR